MPSVFRVSFTILLHQGQLFYQDGILKHLEYLYKFIKIFWGLTNIYALVIMFKFEFFLQYWTKKDNEKTEPFFIIAPNFNGHYLIESLKLKTWWKWGF